MGGGRPSWRTHSMDVVVDGVVWFVTSIVSSHHVWVADEKIVAHGVSCVAIVVFIAGCARVDADDGSVFVVDCANGDG